MSGDLDVRGPGRPENLDVRGPGRPENLDVRDLDVRNLDVRGPGCLCVVGRLSFANT